MFPMRICWNGQPTAQGNAESVVAALMSTIPIKNMMDKAQETVCHLTGKAVCHL